MKKLLTLGISSGALALVATPAAVALESTNTVRVTPDGTSGWTSTGDVGAVTYVDGSPAGLGENSLQLKTTTDMTKATYAHAENMPLRDVMSLSYWTKQVAATSDGGSASLQLAVDLDGDGVFDTNLVYEPYWQDQANPDGAPVSTEGWQQWDVLGGLFWSSRSFGEGPTALTAGGGGSPFYTLAQLTVAYPDANLLGIGVNVGKNNVDYTINVDGVELNGTTYDFEKNVDDGEETPPTVPTTKDECKGGGWKTLANVDGRIFRNQGECVSFAAKAENETTHDTVKSESSARTTDTSRR